MWMSYAEASLSEATDLETTIDRLKGEIGILCWDLVLQGNRIGAEDDAEWRANRIVQFEKSTEAIYKYMEKKLSLEDLIHVLVEQDTEHYVKIDHLPYYLVKKFKLKDPDVESEESIVEYVGEALEYWDEHRSLKSFMKDGVKYFPMYVLKNKITPCELSRIWCHLSEERQSELESYLPCWTHYNRSHEEHIDGPPPSIRDCGTCKRVGEPEGFEQFKFFKKKMPRTECDC